MLVFRRSRPCSPLGAHVRESSLNVHVVLAFSVPAPALCLSTFRVRVHFGSLRRSFTLRGRAHARLTAFMTASTSCERSSALRLRVHGSCSLRSIGRAHHRDAFRARLSALTAWSLPEVNLGALVFRRSPSSFNSRGVSLCARLSTLASRSAVGSQSTGSRFVLTFRRNELRHLATSRSDDDGDRLSTSRAG